MRGKLTRWLAAGGLGLVALIALAACGEPQGRALIETGDCRENQPPVTTAVDWHPASLQQSANWHSTVVNP